MTPTETKKDEVIAGEFRVTDAPATDERRIAIVEETAQPQELAQWTPTFAKEQVDKAIVMVQEKRRFFDNVMRSDEHYAIIPGQRPTPKINQKTGEPEKDRDGKALTVPPKPALLKAGAELLNSSMGLHPVLYDEKPPVEERRDGEWYLEFDRMCEIRRQTGPGPQDYMVVARASGSANSWEEKYRYRGSGRTCPTCEAVGTIIKGNPQYAPRDEDGRRLEGFENGGWLCFKKKGGCGVAFREDDKRITGQSEEKIKNPNPHDLKNTLLKIADKRALVAATLIATGCSDLFTQDIEDAAPAADTPTVEKPKSAPRADARPKTPWKDEDVAQVKTAVKAITAAVKEQDDPEAGIMWQAFRAWFNGVTKGLAEKEAWAALFADDSLVYAAKKYLSIQTHGERPGDIIGADGRLDPEHRTPAPKDEDGRRLEATVKSPQTWHPDDIAAVRVTYRTIFERSKKRGQDGVDAGAFLRGPWAKFMKGIPAAGGSLAATWEALWKNPGLADTAFALLGVPRPTKDVTVDAPMVDEFDPVVAPPE